MKILNKGGDATLNIFCDASITKPKDITEKVTGCAGALSLLMNNKCSIISKNFVTKILPDSTNNNSEVTAVLLGILEALKYNGQVRTINLFSDSKITIYGLRDWVFNWTNNIQDGLMYSTSGTPVANQDIIMQIINYIVYNNLNITLYHQKGHVTGTVESLTRARNVFTVSNGIRLDLDEIEVISYYNNYVDRNTRAELKYLWLEAEDKLIRPIQFPIENCDMNRYKLLIKGEI